MKKLENRLVLAMVLTLIPFSITLYISQIYGSSIEMISWKRPFLDAGVYAAAMVHSLGFLLTIGIWYALKKYAEKYREPFTLRIFVTTLSVIVIANSINDVVAFFILT